jgi:curli biogenesis system outer membrane secretion channel CsgG
MLALIGGGMGASLAAAQSKGAALSDGPAAWRGPKLRIGVMELTGSALGASPSITGSMPQPMASAGMPQGMSSFQAPAMAPAAMATAAPASSIGGTPVTNVAPSATLSGAPAGTVMASAPPPPMAGSAPPPMVTSAPPPMMGSAPPPMGGSAPVPMAGAAPIPMAGGAPLPPTGGGMITNATMPMPMQAAPGMGMPMGAPVGAPMGMPMGAPMGMPMGGGFMAAPPNYAVGLTEMLTTALTEQSQFVVLERSKMDALLNEQNFGASGRVDVSSAAQVGKALGAQALIFGDVTEYSERQSSVGSTINVGRNGSGQVGGSISKVTAQVTIDLRLVDATTGQVITSVRGEGKASATGVAAQYQRADQSLGGGTSAQTPLGEASRNAVANAVMAIVQSMHRVPWAGRVVDVRGAEVYINAGGTQGVTPGMTFDVFSQGETLVDPETHLSLGTPDQRVGSLTIVSVEPQYAVGQVSDGSGFKRSDVVRFKRTGGAQ